MLATKALSGTVHEQFKSIQGLTVRSAEPLSRHTRFGLGGPARLFVETDQELAFMRALEAARSSGLNHVILGGGTNLVVSDAGYDGIVLRYIAKGIRHHGTQMQVDAGAELNHLIDSLNEAGLKGLETLAGIPGWVGAAVYGNAGAYGHSISERVDRVRYFDGTAVRECLNQECEFRYRESVFKRHKDRIIFSVALKMDPSNPAELKEKSAGIRSVRDEKFPPIMKCAGSIFKNILLRDLPESVAALVPASVVREGKIPAAWFLEQSGAKGRSIGGIRVAGYHANLIYNTGDGTAVELCSMIQQLKADVQAKFGLAIEEEVQYVGFPS